MDTLLRYPVVRAMLKVDAHVYGNVVRECFVPNADVAGYLDAGGTITLYARRSMQDVAERGIYDLCTADPRKISITSDYTQYEYMVRSKGGRRPHRVLVSYISDFREQNGRVGTITDFDVNLLQLNRLGLSIKSIPKSIDRHPCPLAHLMDACGSKTLRVVNDPTTESNENFIVQRIADMATRGWKHRGCRVQYCDAPSNDTTCPICLEGDERSDWVRLEPCGHMYHHTCLRLYANEHTRRQAVYPRTVKCPLCRDPIKSYELAPTIVLM